ncbi:type I restriction-modification system R subunit [Aliarcobacter butzleri JV22]|uniref:type I restriction endonuclease subunit R n=1 Tax=Aliarcobacter butzleri TaxID=28197 RepID=UPI0001F0F532|nr:type I restriction endonuclease subunit R [Aliarcobacter butzleri]EFU69587.1 type I restriction-modification system R subunit [Aliarcobacter butzleri JV22]
MSDVGQNERATQNRIVKLISKKLGYKYLGDFRDRTNNQNIEKEILKKWLLGRGVSEILYTKIERQIDQALALGGGRKLYEANKEFYTLLRYGVKDKENPNDKNKTVWLIDWKNIDNNEFSIAEEVTIKGQNTKRPDIVLYVNGIALAVLELKRSSVGVTEGIRQNLDNQKATFIRDFFTTIQLVMAGNDSQGLKYGTVETTEKYYLGWKEENPEYNSKIDTKDKKYLSALKCGYDGEVVSGVLDCDVVRLLNKRRFLELIHDFIVYDSGTKKTCRQNQYFGIKKAQEHIARREGGIIWHTQGSGKSLTMVWLAKWIRENVQKSRVLIITDRTELDQQIEKVFTGVEEQIYRTKNGRDLIGVLNDSKEWLICSLVHKFGTDEKKSIEATDEYIKELQSMLPKDFSAKGELFVFVDECHRTQSGQLHDAMKKILPNAMFIGFTGTPLLKDDKQKSIEVFGGYIHTYKFDEAVKDGVVLDLQYEARDIDQYIGNQKKIDEWFDLTTKDLTDIAKVQLKQKWGTMQKVLSSKQRLDLIVQDILFDMEKKTRLIDGRGNAMLVSDSIYNACQFYNLFEQTDLKGKTAIVTSYVPSEADIKGEESGEGKTEAIRKYEIYRKMLTNYFEIDENEASKKVDEFEKQVKEKFIKEPGQMRLLIVVDKLLTGFDAPSATYLYIDKQLKDHGLFQAICRVNRLDGEDKEYGYIIDYKDLFHKLEGAVEDYTSGALDGYEKEDIQGLLTDRLKKSKERLEEARESIKALCEAVNEPKNNIDYQHYFCGDTSDKEALKENEPKRVALYKLTVTLIRAYANLANEFTEAGYSQREFETIKKEVVYYTELRDLIKNSSGDYIDLKKYEADMRRLIDTYIKADDSEVVEIFEEMGIIELLVNNSSDEFENKVPKGMKQTRDSMAENIENNVRRLITDESPTNPKYYEKMSELLDALIKERKENAIEYKKYLEKIKDLAKQSKPKGNTTSSSYPKDINTSGKRALYDNLEQDDDLVSKIDKALEISITDNWIGNKIKEKKIRKSIALIIDDEEQIDKIMNIIKEQDEYK